MTDAPDPTTALDAIETEVDANADPTKLAPRLRELIAALPKDSPARAQIGRAHV